MKYLAVIKDWQTLIAACIALIAAGIAYWNTTRQLNRTSALEVFRRSRKQAALRAVLPLTLAEITNYALRSFQWLREAYEKCEGETLPHGVKLPDIPTLPHDAISALQDFIEYSDKHDPQLFEDVIARIQIQNARISDMCKTMRDENASLTILKHNIESYLIDTAMIYAGTSSLFKYSRRRSTELPTEISWDKVREAFDVYHFDSDEYPSLHKHISQIQEGGSKPFEK